MSRAQTGGVMGAIGLAEDKAQASIACRQVGRLPLTGKELALQQEIFNQRISVLFKTPRVVRRVERKRNVLVFLSSMRSWLPSPRRWRRPCGTRESARHRYTSRARRPGWRQRANCC